MSLHTRSFLGLLAPSYCAFLLAGCVYLAQDDWPEGNRAFTDKRGHQLTLPSDQIDLTPSPNFKSIKNIKQRKKAFFAFFTPLIDAENSRIEAQHQVVLHLNAQYKANGKLTEHQQSLLEQLSTEYSVTSDDLGKRLGLLERRVLPIPRALVLVQAAAESAWGKSRFAREGNNYFGQWCFVDGCGIVPLKRNKGARHEIAKFASPAESVRAYLNNLNSFSAYKGMRDIRQKLLADNEPITALTLLEGLRNYSERGDDYLRDLRKLIKQNGLEGVPRPGTASKQT